MFHGLVGINRGQLQCLHFLCVSAGKESAYNAGDLGLIPGLGRSPREGKGYPLQYYGLENAIDSIVLGVAESGMTECLSLSTHPLTLCSVAYLCIHSSSPALDILWRPESHLQWHTLCYKWENLNIALEWVLSETHSVMPDLATPGTIESMAFSRP